MRLRYFFRPTGRGRAAQYPQAVADSQSDQHTGHVSSPTSSHDVVWATHDVLDRTHGTLNPTHDVFDTVHGCLKACL